MQDFCLWNPFQLNSTCKAERQKKIASLQRSPTNEVRTSGRSEISLYSWWLVAMYLHFCWLCAKQRAAIPGRSLEADSCWREKDCVVGGVMPGALCQSIGWTDCSSFHCCETTVPEKRESKPQSSQGNLYTDWKWEAGLLLGVGSLDVASFPILLACQFGVLSPPGPVLKKYRQEKLYGRMAKWKRDTSVLERSLISKFHFETYDFSQEWTQ